MMDETPKWLLFNVSGGVRRKKSKIRIEADQVDTHLILARQSEDVIFDKNMITPFPPAAMQAIILCEFS